MDRTRESGSGPSDLSREELWLREALSPEPGTAERVVAAALAAGPRERSPFSTWAGAAAAAVLIVGLAALLSLRPAPPLAPRRAPEPAGSLLLTNASGPVRLVRRAPETAPLPPMVRPAAGCTTLYWSRGSVLAVYESCGDGIIRIEGGAS